MRLRQQFLTKNACYIAGVKMRPTGIVVHSTGANNPNLSRYVGAPGAGWNVLSPDGRSVCCHAFIGKEKDGKIATVQTLPWDMKGWHGGSGISGSVNNGYIGFEICEDGLSDTAYALSVYAEAVELCAMLCLKYKIEPESPTLVCHSEAHKLGIASNHADVMHWFPLFGKNMNIFREDVKKQMETGVSYDPVSDTAGSMLLYAESLGVDFDKDVWLKALTDGSAYMPIEYVAEMSKRLVLAREDKQISNEELDEIFRVLLGIKGDDE